MNVIDSLFTTEFQGDGSSSSITLSNYASRFIADIECLFGPRDRSFTLIGIVIDRTPGNLPQLWFPDSGIPPGDVEGRSKHVVIRLSRNALTDSARARWQLAHECVHVLDPWNLRVDGRPASWLEEGLATWYQNTRVPEAECHEGLYAVAEDLIRPLMAYLPGAVRSIRQERKLRISEIIPDVLRSYCPGISNQTSWRLCQPFSNQTEPAQQDAAIEETLNIPGVGAEE